MLRNPLSASRVARYAPAVWVLVSASLAYPSSQAPGQAAPAPVAAQQGTTNQGAASPASTKQTPATGTTGTRPRVLKTRSDLSKIRLATRRSTGAPVEPQVGPQLGPQVTPGGAQPVPTVPSGPVGELEIPESLSVIEFGELVQGAVRTTQMELVNAGDGPLKISAARASCGCTTAKIFRVDGQGQRSDYINDTELAPGEKFVMEVGVNTDGKQGNWEGTVTLFSNDSSRTDILKLRANVQPFFVLAPSPYLNFDKLFVTDQATRKLTVTSPVVGRFGLKLSPASTLPEYLKVDLTPLEPIDGRATSWEISATLGPGAPEMPSNNWPILLESDVPMDGAPLLADGTQRNHQVNVYSIANVVGMVTLEPNYLSFGIVPPGSIREKSAVIKIHDDSFQLGEVPVSVRGQTDAMTAMLTDHAKAWIERNEAGEPVLKMTISELPESFAGPFGGYIDVELGHPTKPQLSLPFTGVCRDTVTRPTPPAVPQAGGAGTGGL